jgi:hypothetical protein
MLLRGKQDFAARGHDSFDANRLVMVTLRQATRRYACVRKSLRNGNYDHRGILEQAQTLIVAAKEVGHNLKVEPDILESSIRASAFFLPQKYRKGSQSRGDRPQ